VERQIFGVSTYMMLGDESTTLFWEGKWLDGCSIQDIAPDLVALISRHLRKRCMVREAGFTYITGALGALAL
jgi:hypothetical protein